MFIKFFLLFIFVFSYFENLLLGIIVFIVIFLTLLFFRIIRISKSRKSMMYLLIGFVISTGAVLYKHYSFFNSKIPKSGYFQGTGQIIDFLGEGKYLYIDNLDREYIFNSDKQYTIGDKLYTIGYLSSSNTGSKLLNRNYLNLSLSFNSGFDYNKWLFMKHYYGNIYDSNSILLGNSGVGIFNMLKNELRVEVLDTYGQSRQSSLILGMLVGDKSYFIDKDYQMFIDSGLVHIIAVSGGNIIMIVIFLNIVLFFIPFYIRIFIIIMVISFYSVLCGLDSSVFRAWIMGGLGLIALMFGREINIWRLLKYSAIILLLVNPYFLVYDLGFLLSYSAIFGLVFLSKLRERFPRFKSKFIGKVVDEYILANVGASLGVFPIIILFIGKMNLASIAANFLILPLVGFVMIYGFLSIYLFKIFNFYRLLSIEKALINYIYFVGNFFASNGFYIIVSNSLLKYYYFIIFVILFFYLKNKLKKLI